MDQDEINLPVQSDTEKFCEPNQSMSHKRDSTSLWCTAEKSDSGFLLL